jgi:pilus assembly protein CpaB
VVLTTTEGAAAQSETLLTNIKVLAIGLRLGEAGQSGAAATSNPQANVFQDAAIAILELAPGETEAVINGGRQGALSLVLRALADTPTGSEPLLRAGTPGNVNVIRFGNATAVEAHALTPTPTQSEVSSR